MWADSFTRLLKVSENNMTPEQAVNLVLQAAGPEAGEMPPEAIVETLIAAGIPLSEEHLERAAEAARQTDAIKYSVQPAGH